MTLEELIEAFCQKHQTVWLHRDDIKPLFEEYIKQNPLLEGREEEKK